MTRAELIAGLEAAPGPSQELDKEIARSRGFVIAASTGGPHIMRKPAKAGDPSWDLPRYTSSIDAALTLVPEGYSWMCQSGSYAQVWKGGAPHFEGNGTPAIALCIAALKAMEGKDV